MWFYVLVHMHCSEKPALSPFMLESAQLFKVNVTVVVIKSFFSTEMLAKIHFNVKIFCVFVLPMLLL